MKKIQFQNTAEYKLNKNCLFVWIKVKHIFYFKSIYHKNVGDRLLNHFGVNRGQYNFNNTKMIYWSWDMSLISISMRIWTMSDKHYFVSVYFLKMFDHHNLMNLLSTVRFWNIFLNSFVTVRYQNLQFGKKKNSYFVSVLNIR